MKERVFSKHGTGKAAKRQRPSDGSNSLSGLLRTGSGDQKRRRKVQASARILLPPPRTVTKEGVKEKEHEHDGGDDLESIRLLT